MFFQFFCATFHSWISNSNTPESLLSPSYPIRTRQAIHLFYKEDIYLKTQICLSKQQNPAKNRMMGWCNKSIQFLRIMIFYMWFECLKANVLTWRKAFQHAISWKWSALKEFNSLATKSLSVFFEASLLTYQFFPVSAKVKLSCRRLSKYQICQKKWNIIMSNNDFHLWHSACHTDVHCDPMLRTDSFMPKLYLFFYRQLIKRYHLDFSICKWTLLTRDWIFNVNWWNTAVTEVHMVYIPAYGWYERSPWSPILQLVWEVGKSCSERNKSYWFINSRWSNLENMTMISTYFIILQDTY